jgi:hypothetical protein
MRKRNGFVFLVGASLVAGFAAAPAGAAEFFDGRVSVEFFMMQGFQSLDPKGGAFAAADSATDPGFQRTRFNGQLTLRFTDWLTGFIDIAEEPNDFGQNGFSIEDDLSFLDLSVLDAIDSPWAEHNTLIVRLGNPVRHLMQFRGYTDGAEVQSNPLIGNSPYDMVTAETGVHVLARHEFGTATFSAFDWDVAVQSPTFFEDFSDDRGFGVTAKGAIEVTPVGHRFGALTIGGGYSVNDSSGQVPGPGGVSLRPSGATEMVFGDGESYRFPSSGTGGIRNTHAGLLPGIDLNTWLVSAAYEASFAPLRLVGWFGQGKDEFSHINPVTGAQTTRAPSAALTGGAAAVALRESKVQAWGIEAKYDLFPELFYVAGRYTQVTNESDGVVGDDSMDRLQLGVGLWLSDNVLLKGEYVYQGEGAVSPGQIGSDWQGGLIELSAKM